MGRKTISQSCSKEFEIITDGNKFKEKTKHVGMYTHNIVRGFSIETMYMSVYNFTIQQHRFERSFIYTHERASARAYNKPLNLRRLITGYVCIEFTVDCARSVQVCGCYKKLPPSLLVGVMRIEIELRFFSNVPLSFKFQSNLSKLVPNCLIVNIQCR